MAALNFKSKTFIVIDKKGDPYLWIMWFLSIGILRYRLTRIILRLNIIFSLTKYIVQIYYFKDNLTYFVRYGLFFFGEPLAIASMICILWTQSDVEENFAVFPLWTFDSCGEKFRRKIQKDIKICLITFYCVLLSVVVASCVMSAPSPSDKNFLFPVLLIENHWPEQAWFLSLAYKCTLGPLGYASAVYPILAIYGTRHVMYQSAMLKEYFGGILIGSEDMDEDRLFCDKEFQNEVYERISFCVKRQIELIEVGLRYIKLVQDILAVLIVPGYFLAIAIVMFYCSCKLGYVEYTLDNMLFPMNLCFNAVAFFIGMVICGQHAEEGMAQLIEAVNEWKWWALDIRNQKTMLRILVGTKDYKLRLTQQVSLNYDFGVNVFKTIYSLSSLLATFENLNV